VAQIVLLLLSADFIEDKFDQRMDRAIGDKHRSDIVIPVLVRDVDLTGSIFDHSISPISRRAVVRWSNQDQAWKNVSREIRAAVATLRARAKGSLS
jgi:hypothetical protein